MGTEILKSFGTLQFELEQAKNSLKGVDENIKKLIGRDPSELSLQRQNLKRPVGNENIKRNQRGGLAANRRVYTHDSTANHHEPPTKRRGSVFNRLSDRVQEKFNNYEEEFDGKSKVISKVIVTPKEVPSRQEALDAQSKDEKSKARNKRMFGALLGTLQKFRQEETKLQSKELKRAQVEKKIEEIEIKEKAEIKKERKELFWNRKKKQAEIKMIELKMLRMREYAQWEELQKPRMNFIMTQAKPHIAYLPRRLNDSNKSALAQSVVDVQKMIDQRRQDVFDDLQQIEEKMRRNFEPQRIAVKGNQESEHEASEHEEDEEEEKGNVSSHETEKSELEVLPNQTETETLPAAAENTEQLDESNQVSEVNDTIIDDKPAVTSEEIEVQENDNVKRDPVDNSELVNQNEN